MSVQIDVTYDGQLHTNARHGPSGKTLATDAPLDNGGKGESFSPTDLVATALGTCLLTIMGLVAKRKNLDLAGMRAQVIKEMAQQPVRRIASLPVQITIPREKARAISADDRTALENSVKSCPVHASLHPQIQAPITFLWEE